MGCNQDVGIEIPAQDCCMGVVLVFIFRTKRIGRLAVLCTVTAGEGIADKLDYTVLYRGGLKEFFGF